MENGYFLMAKKVMGNEIWSKPAWWFKVWVYVIGNVAFKDHGRFKRGQGLFTCKKIHADCHLAQEGVKPETAENWIRTGRRWGQITTQKTTRGIIITVVNYDKYQNAIGYKNGTENRTESMTQTESEPPKDRMIQKEVKKKEEKNKYAEFVTMTKDEHDKLITKCGIERTERIITILNNYKGANGKNYKSDYLAILNWVVDKERTEYETKLTHENAYGKPITRKEYDEIVAEIDRMTG